MTKPKVSIQFWSALAMLVGGYALAVAGFITTAQRRNLGLRPVDFLHNVSSMLAQSSE